MTIDGKSDLKKSPKFSFKRLLRDSLIGLVFGIIWCISFMILNCFFRGTAIAKFIWNIHAPFGKFTDWALMWRYHHNLGYWEDPLGAVVIFSLCFILTGFFIGIMFSLFVSVIRIVKQKNVEVQVLE